MAKAEIIALTKKLLDGFLAENGLELYDIEYVKEGHDWFLRIYIDKVQVDGMDESERYVGIDDCELVSRFLSEKLDEEDPIEQNYYLEVSSPGLERELKKEEHYRRFTGETVAVSLYTAYEGRKKYEGTLLGLADGVLLLETPEKKVEIPFDRVAKTKLVFVF